MKQNYLLNNCNWRFTWCLFVNAKSVPEYIRLKFYLWIRKFISKTSGFSYSISVEASGHNKITLKLSSPLIYCPNALSFKEIQDNKLWLKSTVTVWNHYKIRLAIKVQRLFSAYARAWACTAPRVVKNRKKGH